MRIRSWPDFLSGLLFCAVALAFMTLTSRLEIGSAARMAAGFFPLLLSILLLVLGAMVLVSSLLPGEDESLGDIRPQPLIAVLASVIVFSMVVERWGFAIAGVLMIVIARLAVGPFRRLEVALLAAALVGVSAAIFLYGLKLPIPFLPR